MSNSSFSNAKNGDGLIFSTATEVTFARVVADGNSGAGLSAQLRSAVIAGSRSENNHGDGVMQSVAAPVGLVRLRCNDITGNGTGLQKPGKRGVASRAAHAVKAPAWVLIPFV